MLGDDLRFVQSCQHIPNFDLHLILDRKLPVFGQAVFIADEFTVFDGHFANIGIFFRLADMQGTADLCNNGFAFWHFARFENFFNARQTGRDIGAGTSHTTGMEGTQSQLGTRLTNRLRGDDTDSRAKLHYVTACQIETIAFGTNTML